MILLIIQNDIHKYVNKDLPILVNKDRPRYSLGMPFKCDALVKTLQINGKDKGCFWLLLNFEWKQNNGNDKGCFLLFKMI